MLCQRAVQLMYSNQHWAAPQGQGVINKQDPVRRNRRGRRGVRNPAEIFPSIHTEDNFNKGPRKWGVRYNPYHMTSPFLITQHKAGRTCLNRSTWNWIKKQKIDKKNLTMSQMTKDGDVELIFEEGRDIFTGYEEWEKINKRNILNRKKYFDVIQPIAEEGDKDKERSDDSGVGTNSDESMDKSDQTFSKENKSGDSEIETNSVESEDKQGDQSSIVEVKELDVDVQNKPEDSGIESTGSKETEVVGANGPSEELVSSLEKNLSLKETDAKAAYEVFTRISKIEKIYLIPNEPVNLYYEWWNYNLSKKPMRYLKY